MTQPTVAPEIEKLLEVEDPDLLRELKRAGEAVAGNEYPKPDLNDVNQVTARLVSDWEDWEKEALDIEQVRFGDDVLEEKWRRHMEISDAAIPRSRLTQNEILRVASMVTRNWYKVEIPPVQTGNDEEASENAAICEKWGNAYFPYMERRSQAAMRREVVDAAAAYGKGCWELYWTGAYDPYQAQLERDDEETDKRYEARTAANLIRAGSPIALRVANHLATRYDRKPSGEVARAVIVEWMDYRLIYDSIASRKSQEKLEELRLPRPGDMSWPGRVEGSFTSPPASGDQGMVECVTYYDGVWWAYTVGGRFVDEPTKHEMGRNPVFPLEGIVTSSADHKRRLLGITAGMSPLERGLDLLVANAIDVGIVYGRPKPALLVDKEGQPITNGQGQNLRNIPLGGPNEALQLNPGMNVVDMFKDFAPKLSPELVGLMLQLWTRSGRNPVAQGAMPGADAVGYVVNTAIQGTDDLYGVILNGDARVAGDILDTVFGAIKHVVQKPVYMPVVQPGARPSSKRYEWLAIRPDNITEVPTIVTINPTSEQNRMAAASYWRQGWMDGVVPDETYIERVYDADDVFAWRKQRLEDDLVRQATPLIVQDLIQEFFGDLLPVAPPGQGQEGPAMMAEQGIPPEGPPGGPTVGASMASASRGSTMGAVPDLLQQAGAGAGQDNGYRPATPATQAAPRRG